MRRAVIVLAVVVGGCGPSDGTVDPPGRPTPATVVKPEPKPDPTPREREETAEQIAHEVIILDGHVDVPWRLHSSKAEDGSLTEDISGPTETGNFDHPRAKKGGLDAPFMSIYVSAKFEKKGAKKVADDLIDMIEGIVETSPDKFALAKSPAEVRANFEGGKISLPLGMENGAPIEGKLENLKHFFDRGIRYITLTHSKDNHISDSSYDKAHKHKGLSKFGTKVVAEMNRLGIMIDVSHISDDAFWQVMKLSKTPVIASHSSCRKFTPGWERNMSDEMIKALAKNGGVIQINFGSGFIDAEIRKERDKYWKEVEKLLEKNGVEENSPEAKKIVDEHEADHPAPYATVEQVADHIEHVIELVGVDHVGFGSDFDGLGDSLPTGLKDASQYPNLLRVLLERGHSRGDIEKVCSGNVLRVWEAVEDHAKAAANE